MEEQKENSSEIVFGLNDNPPFWEKIFAAIQHLCAIFVPIVAPGYVICLALGYDAQTTSTVISMCLIISGIGTFVQIKKIGPFGSGLLSIQGTSSSFIGVLIMIGHKGGLSLIFGSSLLGALLLIILAPFLKKLKRLFPPLVTGIVVMLIGITLMPIAVDSCAGGDVAKSLGNYASIQNFALAVMVLVLVIMFQSCRNKYLRISSIVLAVFIGFIVSCFLGIVDFSVLSSAKLFTFPRFFQFGLSFDPSVLLPILIIYFVSCVEGIGDITATALVSNEPFSGDKHMKRVSGGILGCGVTSFIGNIFSALPLTTFSQNNGIIQITGVASRYVGYYIALFLVLVGIFPIVGSCFAVVPAPVIGGALIMMFGAIAAAGIKILSKADLGRRAFIIISVSLGVGLSVGVPGILDKMPEIIKVSFSSGIATGGLTAVVLNFLMPKS